MRWRFQKFQPGVKKLGPRDLEPLHHDPQCILFDEDATDGNATDADATDEEATDQDATDEDATEEDADGLVWSGLA